MGEALKTIVARQARWAAARGVSPWTLDANLFEPLHPDAQREFEAADGNELVGKMASPHSSSAMFVNMLHRPRFHPDGATLVARVLDLPAPPEAVVFEGKTPKIFARPSNLDALLRLPGGRVVGVESKFSEPYRPGKEKISARYVETVGLYDRLPRCGETMRALYEGQQGAGGLRYQHLDAAQLIKHALGLAAEASTFSLFYVHFAVAGPEGARHDEEVADFAERAGAEIGLRVLTHQALFERMRTAWPTECAAHLAYLDARYFEAGAGTS